MYDKISISVKNIINFVYKHGDITSVSLSSNRAVDGTKAHQKIQKRFANEYKNYESEVTLSHIVKIENMVLNIGGRIDGVILDDEIPVIDEIKSTHDLEYVHEDLSILHWAQGKMYAFMYAKKNDIPEIIVRLTYVEIGSYDIKQFEKNFSIKQLNQFFLDTVNEYYNFATKIADYNRLKEESVSRIQFPFKDYRAHQRKLMASVYQLILQGENLFARAPTGIGKTMATLFPAIKTLEKQPSKIFYLTAKTIGRDVARKALDILEENGLVIKRVIITAKDKICLNDEKNCDGEFCPYAKGHFDRINEALIALIDETNCYSREVITEYAKRYRVCPHELALDLSLYCDCIICDYNYAFDPTSALKRFFAEGNERINKDNYVFLIDEAHNLVERARDMYSSELSKRNILDIKKKVKGVDATLHRYINKMNKFLIDKRYTCDDEGHVIDENYPDEFIDYVKGVVYRTEKIFPQYKNWEHVDDLLDFYFACYDFLKKAELYDDCYVTYYEKFQDEVKIKMFCLDPSNNLKNYMNNARTSILFSATLIPMNYFVDMLGGDINSNTIMLNSPFDEEKLCLLVHKNVSTKYKDREKTYDEVAETIYQTIQSKKGNYIVYFPSYKYMNDVFDLFIDQKCDDSIKPIKQERGLSESEKEEFIESFHKENDDTLIAFAVLGGMFGEGIDLVGEKLSGAIIVGVGLPSICLERNLIKNYFDQGNGEGFKYSYMYPGMNKVMQAAGRVIRSENDIGIVVLIDERFSYRYYREIFPYEWRHVKQLNSSAAIKNTADQFWYCTH